MRGPLRVYLQPDLVLDLEDVRRVAPQFAAAGRRYWAPGGSPGLAEIGAPDDASLEPPAADAERAPEADTPRRTEKSTRRPSLATSRARTLQGFDAADVANDKPASLDGC